MADEHMSLYFQTLSDTVDLFEQTANKQLQTLLGSERKILTEDEHSTALRRTQTTTLISRIQSSRIFIAASPHLHRVLRLQNAIAWPLRPYEPLHRRVQTSLPSAILQSQRVPSRMIYFASGDITRNLRSFGTAKKRIGSYGRGPYHFIEPTSVAIHPITQHIFVCEHGSTAIKEYTPTLEYVGNVLCVEVSATTVGGYNDIAISHDGTLLIALDFYRREIVMIEGDGDRFDRVRATFKQQSSEWIPNRVTFDEQDNFFVANTQNKVIAKYTRSGVLLFTIVSTPNIRFPAPPEGILVTRDDFVYVSSRSSTLMVFCAKTGAYLQSITIPNIVGTNFLAHGPQQTIAVSDTSEGCIMFISRGGKVASSLDVYRPAGIQFANDGSLVVIQTHDSHSISIY
eukprot:TRINITY_DN8110_c0_g1_i1.p1 TRINITY_DN8110_c0_g1~~TRINITY_DN8110_c0_g1_i1.p1  ORF type:complete len:415 (+),score=93.47 TRINITY_DN8110_c0_g1_i1:49-1245(+)